MPPLPYKWDFRIVCHTERARQLPLCVLRQNIARNIHKYLVIISEFQSSWYTLLNGRVVAGSQQTLTFNHHRTAMHDSLIDRSQIHYNFPFLLCTV